VTMRAFATAAGLAPPRIVAEAHARLARSRGPSVLQSNL
jgi:hypothetical protein